MRVAFRLLFIALTATPAVGAPSFDCGKARSKAEKAICASTEASALDAEVANAYRDALTRLQDDAGAVAALKADQRVFVDFRDQYLENENFALAQYLTKRRDFLRAIDGAAREGAGGAWRSIWDDVNISRNAKGDIDVALWTAQPATRSWTCGEPGESARARADGDAVIAGDLRHSRKGRLLVVEDTAQRKAGDDPAGCGKGGTMTGVFFPVVGGAR